MPAFFTIIILKHLIYPVYLLGLFLSFSAFSQSNDFSSYELGDVCNAKYSEFGLGIWHENEAAAYHLRYKEKLEGYTVLAFVSKRNCENSKCEYRLALFNVKDNTVHSRFETKLYSENEPSFETLHDCFILVKDMDSENELSRGRVFVIYHEKVRPLERINLSKLVLVRNLIFAKHGYTFESKALNFHFKQESWYKPLPDSERDTVFDKHEEYLLTYIQELEKLH